MNYVSAGHIILTPTQPVTENRRRRGSTRTRRKTMEKIRID